MSKSAITGVACVTFIGAILLLLDASCYGLMPADSATGRPKGCYTQIQLMFGLWKAPIVRGIEFAVAYVLGGIASFAILLALLKARPQPLSPALEVFGTDGPRDEAAT